MKLLLLCYECSPYQGSERAVGWERLLGAAAVAETHVLTSEANFVHLERARAEGQLPDNVRFYTPEPDRVLRRMERKPGVFAYNYRAYRRWHQLALTLARELHAKTGFDAVHQVTVCTFREPGFGMELGVPFVWGPMGGSQNFPLSFLRAIPVAEACKELARSLANRVALRRTRVQAAAQRAHAVMAANTTNLGDFRRNFNCDVELLLETGAPVVKAPDRQRFEARVGRHREGLTPEPLRLIWSGEHHVRKALPVLLRALQRVRAELPWQLDVLGDGPMRARWERECVRLGLREKVRFEGRLPYADAVRRVQSAEVLCFTSLRDTSGNVVLEALAAGVPVVCFDHQGCGDIVDARCGIKIEVTRPAEAYTAWAQAVQAMVREPERLLELSVGATARAEQLSWGRNHHRVQSVYRRVVGQALRLQEAGCVEGQRELEAV